MGFRNRVRTSGVPPGLAFFPYFYPALTCWANECLASGPGFASSLHHFARDAVLTHTLQPLRYSLREKLFLRCFAVHHSGPLGPILRNVIPKSVGCRRSQLHNEASFHGHAAHLLVGAPCPGIAIEAAFGIYELTEAVELAVGIGLVVVGISHD